MAKKVTLQTVADDMGVSIVTVSNALSGKKGVSARTAEKIRARAEEMGMNLDRYQRQIPSESKTVGTLVWDRYIDIGVSFYWKMYQSLTQAAAQLNCVTLLKILHDDDGDDRSSLSDILSGGAVDGLLIVGVLPEHTMKMILEHTDIPVVLMDFYQEQYDADAVLSNNYIGAFRGTEYLIEQGHREIGFAGTLGVSRNIDERYMGFRRALALHQISCVREFDVEDRDPETEHIILTLPERLPTAYVAGSDYTAEYLAAAVRERGLSIPEDISIVGYDNYLYQRPYSNTLTTYDVDMDRMSRIAVRTLLRQIAGIRTDHCVKYADSSLIIRSSVRQINRSENEV